MNESSGPEKIESRDEAIEKSVVNFRLEDVLSFDRDKFNSLDPFGIENSNEKFEVEDIREGLRRTRESFGSRVHRNLFTNSFKNVGMRSPCVIPDGVVNSSVGVRRRSHQHHVVDITKDLYIFVLPGLVATCYWLQYDGGIPFFLPYENCDMFQSHLQFDSEQISSFRVVSAGVRITPHSEFTQVTGYFEAIRFSEDMSSPKLRNKLLDYVGINYSDHPSFVCGNIKDLKNWEFTLNPKGQSCLFNEYYKHSLSGIVDTYDDCKDCIVIRLVGACSLTVNGISNQEIIYRPGTLLARGSRKKVFNSKWKYWCALASSEVKAGFLLES